MQTARSIVSEENWELIWRENLWGFFWFFILILFWGAGVEIWSERITVRGNRRRAGVHTSM